jgi:hypothetical protein
LFGSSLRLLIAQTVNVADERCETLGYQYRLTEGEAKTGWLIRWDYFREPPRPDYLYPLGHVHVNGSAPATEDLARLHIPTRRVPLELVLWHLITEWGVSPKNDNWQQVLEESIEGYEQRRRAP